MRKLGTDKRTMILSALVEGSSINATARICGVSKITVLRLLADAGTFCAQYHDLMVRDLHCDRVQVDEIWSFCGCKEKSKQRGADGFGSVWTWTAIDADTKLCISYLVGLRDGGFATEFIGDVADRIDTRIQLTSDGHKPYIEAVEDAFGGEIDYAILQKLYGAERPDHARYSPAKCIGCYSSTMAGEPDPAHVNTSYVERQNLTMRMSMRRFTRLTNAFSKKIDNHEFAVALHFFHYNFIRKHQTIKTTPAVAAGLANRAMSVLELVEMIEAEEAKIGGRITDYLPSPKSSKSK